ncbi:MAG TPA: hypothetical protein VGO11_01570 [Chthoniobacteraceae bacterium]|jgi:hypothetical protein|nr:hypothetical protein [Chthoniobacteraceae bacterium]
MRTTLSIFAALAALLAPAVGAPNTLTALQAVKLLPKDAWARLARVEAFEGAPIPERWHILVHDTREENGLHEYVIANGEVVASRAVSQFAEDLKADDIIGNDAVKVDSEHAANLAEAYAEANKKDFATYNYELKKDGDATPVWKVTCVDAKGEEVGKISVSASKGTVVKHEGFAVEPVLYNGMTKKEFAAADAKWERDRAAKAKKAALPTQQRVMRAEPPPEQPRGFLGRLFGGGR